MAKVTREYRVRWETDVEARSPKEAAQQAREAMHEESWMGVFDVHSHPAPPDPAGWTRVDLDDDAEGLPSPVKGRARP